MCPYGWVQKNNRGAILCGVIVQDSVLCQELTVHSYKDVIHKQSECKFQGTYPASSLSWLINHTLSVMFWNETDSNGCVTSNHHKLSWNSLVHHCTVRHSWLMMSFEAVQHVQLLGQQVRHLTLLSVA
jgi:hypothetical protein